MTIDQDHTGAGDNVAGDKHVHHHPPQKPQVIPKILTSKLPLVKPDEVIGRQNDLSTLVELLDSSPMVIVNGLGGMGKSTLAQYYLTEHQAQFDHLAWVNYSSTLEDAFASDPVLAQNLGADMEKTSGAQRFDYMMQELREVKGHNLLIIDNADDDIDWKHYQAKLPLHPNWKIIVTSRLLVDGFPTLSLGALEAKHTQELFLKHYGGKHDTKTLEAISAYVGHHTLVIELLAKNLQAHAGLKFDELLPFLESHGLNIPHQTNLKYSVQENEQITARMYALIQKVFDLTNLDNNHPEECWYLKQCSVLPAAHGFTFGTLFYLWQEDDSNELMDNLNFLVNRAWLNRRYDARNDEDWFEMHPVIQDVVLDRYNPDTNTCQEALETLMQVYITKKEIYITDNEGRKVLIDAAKHLGNFEVLDDIVMNIAGTEVNPEFIWLMEALAHHYAQSNDDATAFELYQDFVKVIQEHPTDEYVEQQFRGYRFMIEKLEVLGRYEAAFTLCQSAMKIAQRFPGDHRSRLAQGFYLEGKVLHLLGEYENAQESLENAFTIFQHPKLQQDKSNLAAIQDGLGQVYVDLAEYEKASDLLNKALENNLQIWGSDHPQTAITQTYLAALFLHLQDYSSAQSLLETALTTTQQHFGVQHFAVAMIQSDLANVHHQLGNHTQAQKLLEQSLTTQIQRFGEIHPSVGYSYNQVSHLLSTLGQKSEALEYAKKAVGILALTLGEDHPDTMTAFESLKALEEE